MAKAPSSQNKKSWRQCLVHWLVIAGIAWVLLTVSIVTLLRFIPPPTSAFMLEYRIASWQKNDSPPLHHHWVAWKDINKTALLAMVASEDQRFPYHHGFDFKAVHAAIESALNGKHLRGASTISQQTAKNLFLWNSHSWLRKGIEAYFTVLLEAIWPKQRILAVYANIAEFGNGIYGIGAASHWLFHTTASQLTPQQAALLAATLPNPKHWHADHPSAYIRQRARWIRRQMQQLGGTRYIDFTRSGQ